MTENHAGGAGQPASPLPPDQEPRRSLAGLWIEGARLRTLPLAVAPVLAGTGAAAFAIRVRPDAALLCLAVALLLQIGVNYANDYSDGIRGTDDVRVGPPRLTASHRVPARIVLTVALCCFGLAAVAGLALVLATGLLWLIAVGAVAILAAWFYTGGSHPYGYHGWGEVIAFVFFGPVAVLGTEVVQTGGFSTVGLAASLAQGSFAAAVLLVNNLRDVDQDAEAGKRTLAVMMGRRRATAVYGVLVLVPYALLLWLLSLAGTPVLLAFGSAPLAGFGFVMARSSRSPRDDIGALQLTSVGSLAYAAMLAFGLSIAPYL